MDQTTITKAREAVRKVVALEDAFILELQDISPQVADWARGLLGSGVTLMGVRGRLRECMEAAQRATAKD